MPAISLFNHVLYPHLHYYLDGQTIYILLSTFRQVINFYECNSHLLNIYIPHGHVLTNVPRILKTKFPKCTIYASIPSLKTPYGTPIMSYLPPYVDRVFVDDPYAYRLHYGLARVSSYCSNSIPPIFDDHTIALTRHYNITGHEHEYGYVEQVAKHASLIKASEFILPYIDSTSTSTDANIITKDKLHIEFQYQTSHTDLLKYKGCRAITYMFPITDVSAFSDSKEVKIFTFTKQIENLHTLSNVHTLILRSCRINGLQGLTNVKHLNISYTNIKTLNGLVNIEELDISHCKQLTDTSALKTCIYLRKLICTHTKIDHSNIPTNCLTVIE